MKKHDWTEQELLLLPRSAEAALTKGSKYYFTGQPCKRRHVAACQTDKKYCVECRREDGLAAAEKRRRRLGMKQWEDIGLKALPVGERSDRLTATGRMKRERFEGKNRKYTQAYDEVNCDCGHTFWLRRWYWGKQVQCRSCDLREKLVLAHAAHSENSMFPHSSKHPRKARMLYAAHNRARKNGLEFDLTIDDLEIPDLCPVLGFPLAELSEKRVNSSPRYNAPSLDRIDPGIGYVRGNIVVMSYRANNIKKDGTAEEHLKVAEFMERMGQWLMPRKIEWTREMLEGLPQTRGQAVAKSLRHYYNNSPCKHGHLSPRLAGSGKCAECAAIGDRNQQRKYSATRRGLTEWADGRASNSIDLEHLVASGLPSTQDEARKTGSKYYFTGKQCKNGHTAPRRSKGGGCLKCLRDKTLGYREKARTAYRAKVNEAHELQGKGFKAPSGDGVAAYSHGKSRSIEQLLFNSAKARARRKRKEFTIKVEGISIPTHCPVLGIKLSKEWGGVTMNNASRAAKPSLDRIDPRKGYVPGNVVVMSYCANLIKGDGLPSEHRAVAHFIQSKGKLSD